MVFLNPAFLIGLIAAGIPVLLHFLNLQKLKRIEFSTLSFLKELQKTKIRKLRFKQWLLLALRILLILLLVSAFARPTLETFTVSGASSAKSSSVFIIDDSFSMSVVKGNGSYYNKAKEIVKSITQDFQEGDEAAILFSTSSEDKKFTTSMSAIESELSNSKISLKKQKYQDALFRSEQLLNESKNFNKELFILSDFANNNFSSESIDQEINVDEKTKVYLINFSEGELNNRSLYNFQLENQLLEPGKTISFSVQVQNKSDVSVSNGIVSLFLNGVRSAQQSFDLDPKENRSISFETVLDDAGLIEALVEVEEDDIIYDNTLFTSFWVPEEINVLLASDNAADSRFIKLALLSSSGSRETNIKEISSSELSYNLDKKYAVIILVGTNMDDASALNKYVEEGGKVIIFPASVSQTNDFQLLLAELGLRAVAPQVGSSNTQESIAYFNKVEYKHPIFSNLFEDKDDTKVESPEVYSYFKILPHEQLLPIISLNDNSLFLSEIKRGSGRILLFNSPPSLSWNNFPVKSLFAPLVNKAVIYQTSEGKSGKEVIAGETVDIRLSELKLPQLRIISPDDSEEFVNLTEIENRNFFSYKGTNKLGTYKFYSGDELIDFVNVNFDPDESRAQYLSQDKIESIIKEMGVSENYTFIDPAENYKQSIKQARFGTEMWKYFLVAALFVALLEMLISKSSKKDLAELNK